MKRKATVVVFATLLILGILPEARAVANESCSNAALHGSFGYTSTGTLLESFVPPPYAGPYADIGRQTFDGKGHTRATMTLSANGNIMTATFEGTYTVHPDCTGSMRLVSATLGEAHLDFVIDDDGAELRVICADSGVVKESVYKKQF
jgi:hypothetical protein